MRRLTKLIVVMAITAFISVPAFAQHTLGTIVRPLKVDARVSGTQIAKPGNYTVAVGDLLEFEYSNPVVPHAMPKKLDFRISDANVLDAIEPVVKNVVSPGLMGNSTKAFCFRAANPGTESLTLIVDSHEYQYSITVEQSGDDATKPELCKGVYSAVQFRGMVYVFANGVQPTAGYQTYLERAKIAIWPPQYSLVCLKPSGVAAQVITPFSVRASFKAEEAVESIIVTDSASKQTIKVVQLK